LWTASSQGLRLSVLGITIGIAGAMMLTRMLEGMLFEVAPTDPTSFAAVAALFGCVAGIASALGANRAIRVDPTRVLRVE
jgi:putative ABC transport system permease protein